MRSLPRAATRHRAQPLPSSRRTRTATALRALLLAPLLVLAGAPPAGALPDLTGHWVLVEDESEDPKDAFKGKLRRERYPVPATGSGRRNSIEASQDSYWETLRKKRERGSLKDLRRLGTGYPLVKATRLDVERVEEGFKVTYDGELPRLVRPNPDGRTYSASGDELVADTLGHTLAYWDGEKLVLDNDPPRGGKIVETFTVGGTPRRLRHTVKIRMRVLKEPVELERVFAPETR